MHRAQESNNMQHRIQTYKSELEQEFLKDLQHNSRTNSKYYDIKCKTKIDFITFSVYLNKKRGGKPDETKLQQMFTDIWCNKSSQPRYHLHKEYTYNQSAEYRFEFEGIDHQVIIAKCSWSWLRPYLITIHDPTQQVLEYLDVYLSQLDDYHIKNVEFTYDFYSENIDLVTQYLKEHAILSWRGKGYHPKYKNTFYGNNIRFAHGKGSRGYKKEVVDDNGENVKVARMEIMYKRPILKKNRISNIYDLINMDSRFVNKYLSFCNFNFSNFEKRMKKEKYDNGTIIHEINNIKQSIQEGYLYEMNQCYKNYYKGYPSLTYLKKNKFWDHFLEQFKPWYSFLDSDEFMLISALMEDSV